MEERQRLKDLELKADNSKEHTEKVPPLVKIPSQKLSVLIKRKNMKVRADLKKLQQQQALSARNATNPQMEHCMTPNSNLTSIANPVSSMNLNQPHVSGLYSQDAIVNETLRDKRKREARKLNTIHRPAETKRKTSPKNLDVYAASPYNHPNYQSAGLSPHKGAPSGIVTSFKSDMTTNFAGNTATNPNDISATNSLAYNQQDMTYTDDQFNSVVM